MGVDGRRRLSVLWIACRDSATASRCCSTQAARRTPWHGEDEGGREKSCVVGNYRKRHRNFGSSVCKLPADTAHTDSRTIDTVDVAREAVASSACRFREQRRARFLGDSGCPFQVARDSADVVDHSSGDDRSFRDVLARFGFPVYVVMGNGPQLISAEFGEFLRKNGVKSPRTTPRAMVLQSEWCRHSSGV